MCTTWTANPIQLAGPSATAVPRFYRIPAGAAAAPTCPAAAAQTPATWGQGSASVLQGCCAAGVTGKSDRTTYHGTIGLGTRLYVLHIHAGATHDRLGCNPVSQRSWGTPCPGTRIYCRPAATWVDTLRCRRWSCRSATWPRPPQGCEKGPPGP